MNDYQQVGEMKLNPLYIILVHYNLVNSFQLLSHLWNFHSTIALSWIEILRQLF